MDEGELPVAAVAAAGVAARALMRGGVGEEALVEGRLTIAEIVGLFWHCLRDPPAVSREALGEAVVEAGLLAVMPAVRVLLGQVVRGR